MSKTIEEIRNDVAIDFGYKNLAQLLAFNDSCIVDIINRVAQRYAQSQTHELQEQNAELVDMLTMVIDVWGYEYEGSTAYKKVDDLLTKHNHLKSNTNEKIDL